ncbi:MAG: hypothetical protein Q9217_001923 [Psora testacea]
MATPTQLLAAKIVGISTAFLTSGGIISLSYSTVPILRSTPSHIALPHLDALFSSGSHIFPQLATLAASAFVFLAYNAPSGSDARMLYLAGAGGAVGIAPFTVLMMKPTNMTLREIETEEEKEGKKGIEKVGGDKRIKELMATFQWMNAVRGTIIAVGAGLGLAGALVD